MMEALYTIFVRIPLIIFSIIFIFIFLAFTATLYVIGVMLHVLLYASGLCKEIPFSDSEY